MKKCLRGIHVGDICLVKWVDAAEIREESTEAFITQKHVYWIQIGIVVVLNDEFLQLAYAATSDDEVLGDEIPVSLVRKVAILQKGEQECG